MRPACRRDGPGSQGWGLLGAGPSAFWSPEFVLGPLPSIRQELTRVPHRDTPSWPRSRRGSTAGGVCSAHEWEAALCPHSWCDGGNPACFPLPAQQAGPPLQSAASPHAAGPAGAPQNFTAKPRSESVLQVPVTMQIPGVLLRSKPGRGRPQATGKAGQGAWRAHHRRVKGAAGGGSKSSASVAGPGLPASCCTCRTSGQGPGAINRRTWTWPSSAPDPVGLCYLLEMCRGPTCQGC